LKLTPDQVHKISHLLPRTIRTYLEIHGWNLAQTYPDNSGSVWVKGDAFGRLLHDPDQYSDYTEIIAQLIVTISDTDDIPIDRLILELERESRDRIRIHIPEPIADDGTIELNRSVEILQSVKNLMYATASSVDAIEGRSGDLPMIYPPKRTDKVSLYGDNLRLGQTEVGSYVITIEIDVRPTETTPQHDLNNVPVSFARKVNTTMITAITSLAEAYESTEQRPEQVTENIISQTLRSGVSVNLCEALSNLAMISDGTYTGLDIDFSWAPKYPVSAEIPKKVSITRQQMQHYAQTARSLRINAPIFNQEFAGYVTKLDHPEIEDVGTATIDTMITIRNERKKARLKITLPADSSDADYFKAVTAHRDRCMLRCIGDLKKEGRGYRLLNPHGIEILLGEENE